MIIIKSKWYFYQDLFPISLLYLTPSLLRLDIFFDKLLKFTLSGREIRVEEHNFLLLYMPQFAHFLFISPARVPRSRFCMCWFYFPTLRKVIGVTPSRGAFLPALFHWQITVLLTSWCWAVIYCHHTWCWAVIYCHHTIMRVSPSSVSGPLYQVSAGVPELRLGSARVYISGVCGCPRAPSRVRTSPYGSVYIYIYY